MTGRHVAQPATIKFTVDGEQIQLNRRMDRLLNEFKDGVFNDPLTNKTTLTTLIHRGWIIRTHGHYELTKRGQEIYTAWAAYHARKQAALREQT